MTIQQLTLLPGHRRARLVQRAPRARSTSPSHRSRSRCGSSRASSGSPSSPAPGRGLVLTEAGRRFRPEAERVLADVERARDAVAEVRDLRGGTLGFGMFGTASAYLIADLAADFRRKYPDVRLRLVGLNSSEVADQVRDATLEAGAHRPARRRRRARPPRRAARGARRRQPRRRPRARARHDRGARRCAADPLRRAVRRRRPDATAARRPRAAGRRHAPARDRGRGNRGRRRARPPRARRHDRAAGRDQPPGSPRPALRLVRRAALRHVRVHRPHRRPALTRCPRVRRDRRAPARARRRSGPVRHGHVRDGRRSLLTSC